jgi:hypothetical protein
MSVNRNVTVPDGRPITPPILALPDAARTLIAQG